MEKIKKQEKVGGKKRKPYYKKKQQTPSKPKSNKKKQSFKPRKPFYIKKQVQQHTSFYQKKMNEYHIYTDGSVLFNVRSKIGGIGGIGVYFESLDIPNISEPFLCAPITNIRAEIFACIRGLESIIKYIEKKGKKKSVIHIYTDSEFFINVMTKWIGVWKRKDWKKADGEDVLNVDLIYWFDALIRMNIDILEIQYHHVKAHKDEPREKESEEYRYWKGNKIADQLAKDASMYQYRMMGGDLGFKEEKEKEKEKERELDWRDVKESKMDKKFSSTRITDFWNSQGEIMKKN
jgi:ribonuclease HI